VLGLFIVKNTLLQAIATHLKQGKTLRDSVQKWTEEGKLRRAIEPNYQYNQDLKALRDQDSILTNMIEFQAEIITFTKITELSPNHYLCVLLPYKIFNILQTHTQFCHDVYIYIQNFHHASSHPTYDYVKFLMQGWTNGHCTHAAGHQGTAWQKQGSTSWGIAAQGNIAAYAQETKGN